MLHGVQNHGVYQEQNRWNTLDSLYSDYGYRLPKDLDTSYKPYFGDMDEYLERHYDSFCESMNDGKKIPIARVLFPINGKPCGYLKTAEGMKKVLRQLVEEVKENT